MKYIVFMVLFVSAASHAAGGLNKNTITKLAFNSDHLFIYAENWNNPSECGRTDAVVLDKSNHNFERAYALILAAFMSGKSIRGYSDDCITWDEKSYNTIRGHKYLVVE